MLPVDLRDLQDYIQRAVVSVARALAGDMAGGQQRHLLDAMQALDHVDAAIDNAFEIRPDLTHGGVVVALPSPTAGKAGLKR
ncbi:hypothetical protein [Paracraurococcus ruber]|uniref:Uncharacterized protein n=1 Tax=Paracraurococcus ruber TaxID=77675 RepID=A0ABS1CQG1_9PROT|nr:hypothetical protein [Paracraurococcus ruber]MBK1656682.1 hypothetical protein [Paracraurococcus ruber]TDG33698.1 hypothetical protein E2C05_02435 [Paracraurococcus ruber]